MANQQSATAYFGPKMKKPPRWWLFVFRSSWWRLVYFQCSELGGMIWQVFADGSRCGICSADAESRWALRIDWMVA
jgi:hypothetical protein